MAIIISIKPLYTNHILSGAKSIELRKKIGIHFQNKSTLYIYSSSPVKAIVGTAQIKSIIKSINNSIDEKKLEHICISSEDFRTYIKDNNFYYLIELENVTRLKKLLPLHVLKEHGFTAPQSFCYASKEIIELVKGYL